MWLLQVNLIAGIEPRVLDWVSFKLLETVGGNLTAPDEVYAVSCKVARAPTGAYGR